jgi:hypothetical protein
MDKDSPIKQFLEASTRVRDTLVKPKGFKYSCIEEFVLKNGKNFPYKPLPPSVKRGEPKMCFKNATQLMIDRDDLTYVEGYALSIIPIMHAWCIDEDGNVVDPTMPMCEYYGIPFDSAFVIGTMLRRKYYGIIDDWENGWPMLRRKDKKWLAKVGS